MNYNRDVSVDVCKGIGIMLMVLGHSGIPKYGHDFIYMFHMPLFFFLSGYCFNEKYIDDIGAFIIRKLKTLWKPYVQYGLLFLLLHNFFCCFHIYSQYYGYNGKGVLPISISEFKDKAWTIMTSMQGIDDLLGGYWFLRELLLGSIVAIISLILIRKIRNKWNIRGINPAGGVIALIAISLLMNKYVLIFPCFNMTSITFCAAAIFMAGYAYKLQNLFTSLSCSFIIAIILVVMSIVMPREFVNLEWQTIIPYALCGIIGSIMVFNISRWVTNKLLFLSRFLSWIGRKTLVILTWHFLSFKITSLLIVKLNGLSIERVGEFPVIVDYANQGWWIFYFLMSMVSTLTLAKVIEYLKSVQKNKLRQ